MTQEVIQGGDLGTRVAHFFVSLDKRNCWMRGVSRTKAQNLMKREHLTGRLIVDGGASSAQTFSNLWNVPVRRKNKARIRTYRFVRIVGRFSQGGGGDDRDSKLDLLFRRRGEECTQ